MGCFTSSQQDDSQSIQQSAKKQKIVIIGLDSSGKTSILQYLKTGKYCEAQPTMGLNVENITFRQRHYLIFDVGGKVRSLWAHYYENLDGLIFVVDNNDKQRLSIVIEEIKKLNKELSAPMLVYFNKCDDIGSIDDFCYDQVLKCIDNSNDVFLQRCSVRAGYGIWEGIEKLHQLLEKRTS